MTDKVQKTKIVMENFSNYFGNDKRILNENMNAYKYVTSEISVAFFNNNSDPDFYPASDELIFISDGQSLFLKDLRRNIQITYDRDPYSESGPDDAPKYTGKISENNFYDGYIGDKNASYQDIVKYIIQTGKIANEYILKNIV